MMPGMAVALALFDTGQAFPHPSKRSDVLVAGINRSMIETHSPGCQNV